MLSLELKFKPEPPILSDQTLNFDFTKFTKWRFVQVHVMTYLLNFEITNTSRRREVTERVDPLKRVSGTQIR